MFLGLISIIFFKALGCNPARGGSKTKREFSGKTIPSSTFSISQSSVLAHTNSTFVISFCLAFSIPSLTASSTNSTEIIFSALSQQAKPIPPAPPYKS